MNLEEIINKAIRMELNEIINKAIPAESCPQKNANAMHRRQVALKRLNEYIADQLSKQFNARREIKFGLGEDANGRLPVQEM